MASTHHHQPGPLYGTSATTNTTFVHADPSNFRAVVQELTGSTAPLHERRQKTASASARATGMMSMTKLEMMSNNYCKCNHSNGGLGLGLGLASPVSTLDGLGRGGLFSPIRSELEHKSGFYLHTTTVSPANPPPKLLPLFPLHSPTSDHYP